MHRAYKNQDLTVDNFWSILPRLFLILKAWSRVTVLLFVIAVPGAVLADETSQTDVRLFEFTSESYMHMGPGRLYGIMASDGSRHRITIYWIEPAVYHDSSFFLGYSDFIFEEDIVHYWIYGMSQSGTFKLSDKKSVPLLPRDTSTESVALSALAIASRIRSQSEQGDIPLEAGKFFRQSRDEANYSYEVPSEQTSIEWTSSNDTSDVQILNALPFGRKYSKETQRDGAIVWQAQKVLEGPRIARITVKPVSETETVDAGNMFDPDTLGQWTCIPESYRTYWSFDRTYSQMKDRPVNAVPSRDLYEKIESYIDKNKIPERIDCAFNQLLFKTALFTGDKKRVCRSAQAVVTALCRYDSLNSYQNLFELAQIDAQIREQYPEQADELLRPLVDQLVRHTGHDISHSLEQLIVVINSNKWFSYGKLLIEEARLQGLVEKNVADTVAAKLEASRMARTRPPADPCEACASVKLYLAQLDADPPEGNLTMDDVRQILQEGLKKPFADANLEFKQELVEDVVRSIRLIAGEGPFHGDQDRLIKSIQRFSGLYFVVFRNKDPIDTVLATFLALSFCDISTDKDHDVLFSQINKLCGEFQTQTNSMLAERGLDELVALNDVEYLFTRYKQKFHRYIDDPLWPAFKFPLTANEETRLRNKLKLYFGQLEPLFDEMELKVKYGGVSDELKKRTCYKIAGAILHLLPQAAFLRKPPYPGVSCQHRGEYGFTAVIRGPLYIEGQSPKEKFKAMKYFHLGHRLEDIVKRERELAGAR